MQNLKLLILLLYIIVQGIQYWLEFINMRHMRSCGARVPEGFENYIDKQTLEKTVAYTIEHNSLAFKESLFSSFMLLIFLFGGLLERYNAYITSLDLPFIVQGVMFFLFLSYINTFLSLPFSLYSTFKIENKYGFNTMTAKLWISDFFKSIMLSTVFVGLIVAGGLFIVQNSPGYWWMFVWLFFFVFSIFMMYISPYVIEPLFNKFIPLEGSDLEERIKELLGKTGITVSKVFRIDASKRSKHTNAYFTGIGKVKRIVLYDTLLQQISNDEVLAVLAHEVGHWKKKHIVKMIVMFEALSLVVAYIAYRVLKTGILATIFGIQGNAFFVQIVLLSFIFSMLSFPFTPIFSAISRRNENEADKFAIELTGRPEDLANSLIKLSRDNLSNLYPHPLYAKIYYSHPPVVERVKKIFSFSQTAIQ